MSSATDAFQPSKDIQEAIKLIRDMTPIIDSGDDYLTIVGAEEQIAATAADRKRELECAHAKIKSLSRALDTARASASRPPSVPSASQHASSLNELDTARLSLYKAINDAEGSQSAKEAELASLREESRELEASDPAAEHERELNGTALRLQMYKGMGFEPVLDRQGNIVKMLVRAHSGDVHCVAFDGQELEYESVQKLWQLSLS